MGTPWIHLSRSRPEVPSASPRREGHQHGHTVTSGAVGSLLRRQPPPGTICAVNPRARIAVIVAALVAVGAFVLAGSGSNERNDANAFPTSSATPTLPPGCVEDPPAKQPMPSWFPRSLPLPRGTYVHEVPAQAAPGVHTAMLFMPVSLDDFVKLVLDTWEDAGWTPGIGEREPGEAEDTFTGPAGRYGKFRAQSFYCDTETTNLYIAFATQEPTVTVTSS